MKGRCMSDLTAVLAAGALLTPLSSAAASTEVGGMTLFYDTVSGYDELVTGDISAAVRITGASSVPTALTIPAAVTSGGETCAVAAIGDSAFMNLLGLTSLSLPEGLCEIGASSFAGCLSLEHLVLPSTVESVGTKAFMSCTSMKSADLGGENSRLLAIPEGCFSSCIELAEIYIPPSVTAIGKEAFYGCALTSAAIPASVKYIGENAIGMRYDIRDDEMETIPDFIIFGSTGSAAQSYAAAHSIEFLDTSVNEPGDVNLDGFVDSNDASAVLVEYARLSTGESYTFTAGQRWLADMDGDGEINSNDASVILSVYADKATS